MAPYDAEDERRFQRAGRGSRPRTKNRPTYDKAVPGLVVSVNRGRYAVRVVESSSDDHEAAGPAARQVVAMKARALGRQSVVVGDSVRLVGDASGDSGSLARIVEVEERHTVLRRTADDIDPVERVVVANARQLAIVTAVANPEPRPRLIDRALVAAFDAGLEPLLCVTKVDLADPAPLLQAYQPLDVPHVSLQRGGDLDPLRERLRDTSTVLLGHSGVGKSTLVNALVPGTERATGLVNAVTGRGRHTSSSVVALPLPFGGWVIDTPGIRSFGLAHVDPGHLLQAFTDLQAVTADCPRGCPHSQDAPECALDEAARTGQVDPARVASYRRLLASRSPSR